MGRYWSQFNLVESVDLTKEIWLDWPWVRKLALPLWARFLEVEQHLHWLSMNLSKQIYLCIHHICHGHIKVILILLIMHPSEEGIKYISRFAQLVTACVSLLIAILSEFLTLKQKQKQKPLK